MRPMLLIGIQSSQQTAKGVAMIKTGTDPELSGCADDARAEAIREQVIKDYHEALEMLNTGSKKIRL